jgi:C4-dicarboxylate-specific signal transduction histidine kinase
VWLLTAASPDGQGGHKRILLLYDEDKEFPGLAILHKSLRSAFAAELGNGVDFHAESMNRSQLGQENYDDILSEYKWYLAGGAMLMILQAGLIAGLLRSRAQRRRADLAARASEAGRRKAEDEVQVQRAELAHALRVTTLGELTASIAHELNQPLTAVTINARTGNRLLKAGRHDELENILNDIVRSAMRAGDVVHRIRTMVRKGSVAQQVLDINELVIGVTSLTRRDVERTRAVLRLALAEGLPRVLGDPVQLQQVILNLLLNACDAVAGREIGPRTLDVATFEAAPGRIVVTIRDTGIGIAESDLERIFEPFVTTKDRGLGMGLAISRSIVEAHGGRIWATRNDDRGVTMHLELPAVAVAGAA